MKITGIETIVINTPMVLDGPDMPKLAGVTRSSMDTLLVRVDTDEGVSGWGEGFGHRVFATTKAAVDTLVGPMFIGRDPLMIGPLVDGVERSLAALGRNGPAIYALSAIDIALWDIAGKVAGMPLHALLGGAAAPAIPAYASLLRFDKPDAVARRVETMLRRGYRQVKVHETTVETITAAREAAGAAVPLMVDCSWRWTIDEAVMMARRLQPLELKWIEEPIFPPEDHLGLRRVGQEGGIPIAAGENAMLSDFRNLFATGALAYAQPSVTKVGGVTGLRRVIALADAFGVTVSPHSAYFGPGLLATIHCAAALVRDPLVERYDADFETNPLGDSIVPDGQGNLQVPTGPGLGIDPDPGVLKRLRVA